MSLRKMEFVLLSVALLSSISFGQLLVAWPFYARHLGASASQVGLIGGLYQGCYALALIVGRPILDRFTPRVLAMTASLLLAFFAMVMSTVTTLTTLFVIVALFGLSTFLLWPAVMGAIATGFEGRSLNRRLGRFNAAWSIGLIIGPAVGGWLYSFGAYWPFLLAGTFHLVSAGFMWRCPTPKTHRDQTSQNKTIPDTSPSERNVKLRSMARVGLVCGYFVFGMMRFQLPNLAAESGLTAADFGPISATLSLSTAIGFILLGRVDAWRNRGSVIWIVQLLLAITLLILVDDAGKGHLYLCSALAGFWISFLYASHLYYGVSGRGNRARLMAIHELLLSAGFLTGALGGGLIADLTYNRFPYLVGCVVLLVGVVAELLLANGRPHPQRKSLH